MIGSGGVNSVFIRDDFPEFGTDLVTTLSSLDVNDFSHFFFAVLKFLKINLSKLLKKLVFQLIFITNILINL